MGKKKKTNDTRGYATSSVPSKAASSPPAKAEACKVEAVKPKAKKSKWYKPPKEPAPLKSMEELKAIQKQQKLRGKQHDDSKQSSDTCEEGSASVDDLLKRISILQVKTCSFMSKDRVPKLDAQQKAQLETCELDETTESSVLGFLKATETKDEWLELPAELPSNSLEKLWVNYATLSDCGYREEVIKRAFEATGGYDLSNVIDYISIHSDAQCSAYKGSIMAANADSADKEKCTVGSDSTANVLRGESASGDSQKPSTVAFVPELSPRSDSLENDVEEVLGMGDMFLEQAAKPLPHTKSQNITYLELEYTDTGKKSPKQLLRDTTIRQFSQSRLDFKALPVRGGGHACKLTVFDKKDRELVVCSFPDNVRARTVKEAEHYVSTRALYELFPNTSMYTLLPRVYGDLWISWRDEKSNAEVLADNQELLAKYRYIQTVHEKNERSIKVAAERGDRTPTASWLFDNKVFCRRREKRYSAKQFEDIWGERKVSKERLRLSKVREELPVYKFKNEIVASVVSSRVTIVSGATGSGKSTQVGQFLVEHALDTATATECNILCIEPRRISTISLAQRVSQELGEPRKLLGKAGSLVGYQVRFNSQTARSTLLTFCTAGVALRRIEQDPQLAGVSHVIIDEVHERSLDSDLLLALLRRCPNRELKLVLMSATAELEKLRLYFNREPSVPCIEVPGRTFPVERFYLEQVLDLTGYVCDRDSEYAFTPSRRTRDSLGSVKVSGKGGKSDVVELEYSETDSEDENSRRDGTHPDIDAAVLDNSEHRKTTCSSLLNMDFALINYDLILQIIYHILDPQSGSMEGAILVFLPGHAEITKLYTLLSSSAYCTASKDSTLLVLPLHSELTSESQSRVFEIPPPRTRKIVLSTDIAETGVTIPDAVYVIDSGRAKQRIFNTCRQVDEFKDVFVSQANVAQRCGRAGRVRPGVAYCLFTRKRYNGLQPYPLPEILRISLENAALRILLTAHKRDALATVKAVESFFQETLDRPGSQVVQRSVERLVALGAVDGESGQLTALGYHVAHLPMDILPAKMLLYGVVLGCLEPMLTIAAADSCNARFFMLRSFFDSDSARAVSSRSHVAAVFGDGTSDHFCILNAYRACKRVSEQHPEQFNDFCVSNYINKRAIAMIDDLKENFERKLVEIGFLEESQSNDARHNAYSLNHSAIRLALSLALYPHVAQVSDSRQGAFTLKFANNVRARVSGGSTISRSLSPTGSFYLYQSTTQRYQALYIEQLSLLSPTRLIFASKSTEYLSLKSHNVLVIDQKVYLRCKPKTLAVIRRLKSRLNKLLVSKISSPSASVSTETVSQLVKAF